MIRMDASGKWGRSPHARGSLKCDTVFRLGVGSIPACAGEPVIVSGKILILRVDPRMRGGAPSAVKTEHRVWGRSPHARGSLSPQDEHTKLDGSIPACAGEPLLPGRTA